MKANKPSRVGAGSPLVLLLSICCFVMWPPVSEAALVESSHDRRTHPPKEIAPGVGRQHLQGSRILGQPQYQQETGTGPPTSRGSHAHTKAAAIDRESSVGGFLEERSGIPARVESLAADYSSAAAKGWAFHGTDPNLYAGESPNNHSDNHNCAPAAHRRRSRWPAEAEPAAAFVPGISTRSQKLPNADVHLHPRPGRPQSSTSTAGQDQHQHHRRKHHAPPFSGFLHLLRRQLGEELEHEQEKPKEKEKRMPTRPRLVARPGGPMSTIGEQDSSDLPLRFLQPEPGFVVGHEIPARDYREQDDLETEAPFLGGPPLSPRPFLPAAAVVQRPWLQTQQQLSSGGYPYRTGRPDHGNDRGGGQLLSRSSRPTPARAGHQHHEDDQAADAQEAGRDVAAKMASFVLRSASPSGRSSASVTSSAPTEVEGVGSYAMAAQQLLHHVPPTEEENPPLELDDVLMEHCEEFVENSRHLDPATPPYPPTLTLQDRSLTPFPTSLLSLESSRAAATRRTRCRGQENDEGSAFCSPLEPEQEQEPDDSTGQGPLWKLLQEVDDRIGELHSAGPVAAQQGTGSSSVAAVVFPAPGVWQRFVISDGRTVQIHTQSELAACRDQLVAPGQKQTSDRLPLPPGAVDRTYQQTPEPDERRFAANQLPLYVQSPSLYVNASGRPLDELPHTAAVAVPASPVQRKIYSGGHPQSQGASAPQLHSRAAANTRKQTNKMPTPQGAGLLAESSSNNGRATASGKILEQQAGRSSSSAAASSTADPPPPPPPHPRQEGGVAALRRARAARPAGPSARRADELVAVRDRREGEERKLVEEFRGPLSEPSRLLGNNVVSVGSLGHPMACGLPCKYAHKRRKNEGCRDGAKCVRCHLCPWTRQSESGRTGAADVGREK